MLLHRVNSLTSLFFCFSSSKHDAYFVRAKVVYTASPACEKIGVVTFLVTPLVTGLVMDVDKLEM